MYNTSLPTAPQKRIQPTAFAVFCAILLPPNLSAFDIERISFVSKDGIQLLIWPRVAAPAAFVHDRPSSQEMSINAFVPKGQTFDKAPAIFYARASYRPAPSKETLAEFIRGSQQDFREARPGVAIVKVADVIDGRKQKLPTYRFRPSKSGDWETVAYGKDGDYMLIFALSAKTRADHDRQLPKFAGFVRSYQ